METASEDPVHQEAQIQFTFGHKVIQLTVVVVDIIDDLILGLDIKTQYGFVMDISNRILNIDNEEILLCVPNWGTTKFRLF